MICTPTPWKASDDDCTHPVATMSVVNQLAQGAFFLCLPFEDYEHACLCVNNHDELVAVCEDAADALEVWEMNEDLGISTELIARLRAIAKAEVEVPDA